MPHRFGRSPPPPLTHTHTQPSNSYSPFFVTRPFFECRVWPCYLICYAFLFCFLLPWYAFFFLAGRLRLWRGGLGGRGGSGRHYGGDNERRAWEGRHHAGSKCPTLQGSDNGILIPTQGINNIRYSLGCGWKDELSWRILGQK